MHRMVNYISPKAKAKYRIVRCCATCGRPFVAYLDKDRRILNGHGYFWSLSRREGDPVDGEYWECKRCLSKAGREVTQ